MSLILDALNRSRNDAQQVPGLATSYPAASDLRAGGWRAWLLPGALAVAVVLIIWLLWERLGEQAGPLSLESPAPAPGAATIATAPAPAPTPAEPAPAPAPTPTPAIEPVPAAAGVAATQPAPALPTTPTDHGDAAATGAVELPGPGLDTLPDQGALVAEGSGAGADSASASVAALYRQQQLARREVPTAGSVREAALPAGSAAAEPAAPESRAIREQPIDIGEMLEMAEDELENARLAEHPAPFLSALSQQTKDTIPTLLYQAHDYTSSKADSFVLINGKKLKRGDSSKGVRVDEILPDSVVLSFQGTQFRLRALNSWVNL